MTEMMNLYQAKGNKTFHVTSVPNIGLLKNIGFRKGTKVSVEKRYAFGGPVLLKVEDAFAVAIGKDIATQVAVEEAALS